MSKKIITYAKKSKEESKQLKESGTGTENHKHAKKHARTLQKF